MTKKIHSRKVTTKSSARLGAYLAAGVGASLATSSAADAAIIGINVGPTGFNIGGVNGGVSYGTTNTINSFPFSGGGSLRIYNYFANQGLDGEGGLEFATTANTSPINFAYNSAIGVGSPFSGDFANTAFRYNALYISPDFGPGSYMGFRTASGNYGWLEVTWDTVALEFQILSGAYESVSGVAILAGATSGGAAAVPEPSTFAMGALLSGGAAFVTWRKRRQKATKKAA